MLGVRFSLLVAMNERTGGTATTGGLEEVACFGTHPEIVVATFAERVEISVEVENTFGAEKVPGWRKFEPRGIT